MSPNDSEAQNILAIQKEIRRLLSEQIDRLSGCIHMVLAALPPELRERVTLRRHGIENWPRPSPKVWTRDAQILWEIVQAIDWDRLEEVAKQSSAPPIGRKE